MRSMKRFLALVMAALMLVGMTFISVSAAEEEVDYTDAAQRLASINIMKGDQSGNLMIDSGVTRYQAALFFVQALTGETTVEKWNDEPKSAIFSDVPEYGTAIDYAYGIGLILGRGNGVYGYNDPITYQDMLVLAVRALGYETEGMSYPYGYILEADKLGLTDNLAKGIANTKALTRGETAQIIWDMLNIQIAVVDPVTDKILYPDQYSISDSLLGAAVERTTLLEEAGFSQTVIEATIVEYNPAESSKDISHVVLDNGMEIASADLGITPRTNPSEFLGLPVTLYVDSASEDEFEQNYDIVADDSEASIIFADFLTFTTVKNIADEENIKVTVNSNDIPRITLGNETFSGDKYLFDVRTLTEDGWESVDFSVLSDNFIYETKKGFVGNNSYGEISYAVDAHDIGSTVLYELILLYKPYSFGQYFTRTMRYQPTVSDESFITIGTYSDTVFTNVDDDESYFVETVLGSDLVFDQSVTSISKSNGEASRDAKISGGSVRSGDFIFYYYNELDNVLTIGYNCGGLQSGTLKSYNSSKETIKIGDTTYEYGFAGAFASDLPEFESHDFSNDYIANISDEDNAEFVAVDGKILYVQAPLNPSSNRIKHNYVVATTDPEVMSELLDMEEDEYERKLTDDGVYVSESGNMTIAVLNTANGKWGLAEVSQYECGHNSSTGAINASSSTGYDHDENEFPYTVDIAQGIEYYGIFQDGFKGFNEYKAARNALLKGGMFAVRENKSGVYKLSVMFSTGDYGMINNGLVTDGIYFSDAAPKTNDLKSVRNESTDPARITLNANTVIVLVDKSGEVGVRVGIQGEENSIIFEYTSSLGETVTAAEKEKLPGFLYSGTSKLIVLRLPTDSDFKVTGDKSGETITLKIVDADGNTFSVADWAGEPAAGADETYYVGLNGASVEYERLDDGTYELTVSGLYNLRTMRAVSAIKYVVDDLDETDIEDTDLAGEILYMDKKGNLSISDKALGEALADAVNMRFDYSSTDDERYFEITSDIEFVDDSSISVTIGDTVLDKKNAVGEIEVNVATLDATDIDWEEFDINDIAYAVDYDEDNEWGVGSTQYSSSKNDKYYEYEISDLNATETISEPVAGVLDQYIIDTAGEELLVAAVDGDYYDDAASVTVELFACGQFDEDTGVVSIYVLKVLVPAGSAE